MIRSEGGYILLYFLLLLMILLPIIAGIVDMVVEHREILSMRLHQVEARKIALNVIERLKQMENCDAAFSSYGGKVIPYADGTARISIEPCLEERSWQAIIRIEMGEGFFQAYEAKIHQGKLVDFHRYYAQ